MRLGRMSKPRRQIVEEHSWEEPVSVESETERAPLLVQNLSKLYKGGVWANREINLTGHPGEILGILGPNGAGKTTLVRQITTELLPTSGCVSILGHDVVREPKQVKSLLGIVPQEAALFDYLTVYQHLRIFAKLRGLKHRESCARAEQLIQDLDLIEYRNVTVRKLSGGLRRRVLVGIASAAQPSVMILDEPTTGLDPQSRRNLWSLLRKYRDDGAFVLLTTHSMEEAEAICDRVGIIQGGRLLVVDTLAGLLANHGFGFKITYFADGSAGEGVTIFGVDGQELVEKVREMGYSQYSVGRTSLEDVYLAMTGAPEEFTEEFDDGER